MDDSTENTVATEQASEASSTTLDESVQSKGDAEEGKNDISSSTIGDEGSDKLNKTEEEADSSLVQGYFNYYHLNFNNTVK